MNMPEKPEKIKPEATNLVSTETAFADFVTVITTIGRANKLVTKNDDGSIKKDAGPPISEATAQTTCHGWPASRRMKSKIPGRRAFAKWNSTSVKKLFKGWVS